MNKSKLYIVFTSKGFGKARNIGEAITQYQKFNGKLPKEYKIHTFESEREGDVSIDLFNWYTTNHAKFIRTETIGEWNDRASKEALGTLSNVLTKALSDTIAKQNKD